MPPLGINVFRDRDRLLASLASGAGLPDVLRRMVGGSLLCALAYGAVLGLQMGGWQVVSSPVKFPLILLGTSALCVAALYVLLALAGGRYHWRQVACLALCSVSASGLTMGALLPVTAFWTFAFHGDRDAVTLLHTAAFFLAGAAGTRFGLGVAGDFLHDSRLQRVMLVYMGIFGLVAQQMAWIFRPHFHATTVFMRPLHSGGSAVEALLQTVLNLFR